MNIKIKKLHENAVIPKYSKPGDAGMDLTAVEVKRDTYGNLSYSTGLSVEIPEGYVGLLFPRSSISKTDLRLANSVGVIDSGYRGEIILKFILDESHYSTAYNEGDRVGQLIILPYPTVIFEEVDELPDSDRGSGGFGSSGN